MASLAGMQTEPRIICEGVEQGSTLKKCFISCKIPDGCQISEQKGNGRLGSGTVLDTVPDMRGPLPYLRPYSSERSHSSLISLSTCLSTAHRAPSGPHNMPDKHFSS